MPVRPKRRNDEIYCRPRVENFHSGQAADLDRYLLHVERNTTAHPISDESELMLGTDGSTQRGGYHYTVVSFRQLAQVIAPGLSTLLPDLSGAVRRKGIGDDLLDAVQARRIFNDLVQLRFSQLSSYRLLRNETDKTIDGLIGHKHRSLENRTLLLAANDAVPDDVIFHAGSVIGRKVVLWYRSQHPMFSISLGDEPWPFFYGYYFHNGEATGTSVRGGLTVFTPIGTCLSPITKNHRVTHVGRDFNQRLSKMFQFILNEPVDVDQYHAGVDQLLETPLGYGSLDDRAQKNRERTIVRALGELGIPQRWAADCLNEALYVGRAGKQRRPVGRVDQLFASRTTFDLFCPVIRLARALPTNRREKIEQAAYKILIGKLEL